MEFNGEINVGFLFDVLRRLIIIPFFLACSDDEWDKARLQLNLPAVSAANVSLDGSNTFSFEQSLDFELCYDGEEYSESKMCLRGETEQLCLNSVPDPTMRCGYDWCHVLIPGRVSTVFLSFPIFGSSRNLI